MNGVQALGIIVFLIVSPFSVRYALGDLCMKTNNLLGAEYWYKKALSVVPDNIDVTFEMALLYRKRAEYEAAFSCLEKVYAKNPKFLGPFGLELIPDTLVKMSNYDGAIAWCDKILNTNHRMRGVKEVIGKKRDDIMAEKARNPDLEADTIQVSN